MRSAIAAMLLGCLTGGCSPSPPKPAPERAQLLSADDDRRTLVGRWAIAVSLSARRHPAHDSTPAGVEWDAAPVPNRWATGTITISDTASGVAATMLRMRMDLDFTPLLARQVSCYEPGPGVILVRREGSLVSLGFTANAADCGFDGNGELIGDTLLVGEWSEESFLGPVTRGRLRMSRLPAAPGPA
jgi:hypothetical protein